MKRISFAWVNIVFVVVLAIIIFVNRAIRFYDPRSWAGYLVYVLFVIAAILAIIGLILTIIHQRRASNRSND